MMPGETRSAAPGTAAELARCEGCASLQQNLNEYVDALITLKQKIINTDNLLTEYQKKCDELQFARRENSTLHHQVEQMLQKISPLQKCQEELGSLKAELEEKKSSLKLYQDTHQEYARIKEECLKSDAQKKKLEAKVKKLEEAAVKQIQNFKQLRNEKKVLEKEFKKTQEMLDEFSKQKDEKELRHIGTQISSDSYGSIDKRKVKLLLKELWLCINTTHRLPGEGSKCIQDISTEKSAKENTQSRESMEDCVLPPNRCSPLRTSEMQTCLAKLSMEIDADYSSCRDVEKERPSVASHSKDHMFNEHENPEVFMQGNTGDDSTDFSHHEDFLDDDLQAAVDFFKLPPPLLSPVPSPPLMSLPHLGPLRSSLTPETFFGEYTDSSDDDSTQHKTSAESILEEDITEPHNYFGLSRNKERGALDEQPKPPEATHVTTAAFETSTATWSDSAMCSLASEKHLAASSEFINDKPRDIFNDAKRQIQVREMDKSVQTEKAAPKPSRTLCLEMLSGDLAHEKGAAVRKSGLCCSPLSKRPLSELTESEEENLLSRLIESPKSELTKRTLRNETTSESECRQTVSDCFQGVSGEMEKEGGDMQRFFLGESREPEEESASDVADAAGLPAEARSSSSAPSVAFSGYRNRQSAAWWECDSDTRLTTRAALTELSSSGKHLQIKTLNTLEPQFEPPECSRGQNRLEPGLHALNSELAASNFNAQTSSEKECTKIVKGMTKVYSLPQSVFMKATKDGQCESEDPKLELTLNKPDYTSVINSQGGLIKSAFGFAKSTSWHHSDLLRQDGDEHLRATSGHEQDTGHQCKKAAPSLGNRGSASKFELPRENNNPLEFKAASLLSNQVSVITKQVKPEKIQSGRSEHFKLQRSEPHSAIESINNGKGPLSSVSTCAGEREDKTQKMNEVTTMKRAPLEVSASWRKLDLASPGGSLPVGNSHCSTDSKLSFSSENKQNNVKEASVQEEPQKQSQFPSATAAGLFGVDVSKLLPDPDVPVSEGFPVGELPCGDTMGPGSRAPAVPSDSPSVQKNSDEPLKLKFKTPGGACPQFFVTSGTTFSSVFSRKDEETHDVTQSKLADTSYCYTDIREGQNNDTEGEESEPLSCSEGENENENIMGNEQQDVTSESLKDLGNSDAGVSETGPSIEVGFLTSALQDFNISTFSDLDRLSTSEVVMFLESCQLRDYSSADSVSECSSKGALYKEMNKELKQSETSGEEHRKQSCEEETLETSEDSVESEDDDYLLRNTSQLTQCSLETLSKVLTDIGPELQTNYEDSDDKDTGNLLFINTYNNETTEHLKEKVPPLETVNSSHTSELPLLIADLDPESSSPVSDGFNNKDIQSIPKDGSDAARQGDVGEELLATPAQPSPPRSDSAAEPATEQSSNCEAEATFQCQIATVTSEVINVLINKDQNLVIEKGDNWTIINGVAVMPGVDQVILCGTPEDIPVSQDQEGHGAGFMSVSSAEKALEDDQAGSPFQEPHGGISLSCAQEEILISNQSTNFDKSRLRNRPVKPSVRISSEIYHQNFESQIVSDHTYYNSKLEPFGKNKNRSKISNKDQSNKPTKALASSRVEINQSEVSQSFSGNPKTQRSQTQTILANADTSTPTDCSPDTLSKIRQEVGPPLPPLLAPLIATPPRTVQLASPLISSCSPSSPASPAGHVSPVCEMPVPPPMSPLPDGLGQPSPLCASPSPSAASIGERVLSSPLQFCAATPKHALPVPGRLPPLASGHTAVAGPQENSVKILDTMYPELSARARTLSILKGNLHLKRGPTADCANLQGAVSAITGFKGITSTSTAFVKTGVSSGSDCNQDKSGELRTHRDSRGKRTLSASTLRSAKRLRLDTESPELETREAATEGINQSPQSNIPQAEVVTNEERSSFVPAVKTVSQLPLNPKETVESHDKAIAKALKKMADSSFDLLPVVRSHVYVGNISKKPVMRDQEKEVVYEFSTTKKHLAECLLHSILSELKIQKVSMDHNYIHALCRVYVGICRQLGDLERARLFCYSILKEDFPESEKLTLFIANMWHDIFISQSVINKAMQLVARQRAKGEVLNCLRAFLNWEKNAPVDVGFMVSKLLLTIQLCPKTEFQSSEKFGEDLSDNTWEYIFAIDLLCCHQKWVWTHDNIISKELWPVMDKWIKYRKGHADIACTPDIIIASTLRLIGRLGQLGLKEGFPSAVKNISSVIGMFIQHAQQEDIPWGIQLAAVYALCDLSPSNPTEISKILEAWRKETSNSVPSVIVSYLEEASSLGVEELS